MTMTPMYMVPGICLADSNYSLGQPFNFVEGRYAKGRWANGNFYRFTAGFPEKIGGWIAIISAGLVGTVRCLRPWLDANSAIEIGIGTESHLYAYVGTTLKDITPKNLIVVGTLTNPFTSSNGLPTVAVADTSNELVNGDWVFLSAANTVGGLTIDGYYMVSAVVQGTGYSINAGAPASSNAAGVGGTTTFRYPRYNLTNPFATSIGSKIVTVTDNGHGANSGDYVTFSGASAYNGITVNGQYQLTVVNVNSYTILASVVATGNGAGGGGTVSTVHNISVSTAEILNSSPYGSNAYGVGPYGFSATESSIGQPLWTLAPYGNLLLAAPFEGTIYMYDPVQGGVAFPVLNAPNGVRAMFVTPERFIIALGQESNGLTIAWPDQAVITDWTASAVNTANQGRTLQGGSGLVGGLPVAPGVSLFFSDKSVFALEYTGDSEVYNSPLLADNCGLVAPNACVAEGGVAYWFSDSDFWTYNGAVSSLPSDDIRDYVFNHQKNSTAVNLTYRNKFCVGMCRSKKEVWFFYVSQASTEIDSYVIYHYDQQCWSVGQLQRTAWVDTELLSYPIASDAIGDIFQQEVGTDANGSAINSFIQTGPIDLSNGETSMDIGSFTPDFERVTGTVNLSVLTRYYPEQADSVDGPYPLTAGAMTVQDLRSDGRMVAALFSSNQIGGDWRLGLIRFDIKPAGARR